MADITTITTGALETLADEYVQKSTDTQVSLARVFAELFAREAHEDHDMPFAEYWRDMRGVSPETFTLAYAARRELVTLTPDATLAQHIAMTGASQRTIARDRADLGTANPNRQAGQEGKHDKPADDTDATTDATATADAKEARNGGKPDAAGACVAYLAQLDTWAVVNLLVRAGHGGIVALEILADRDKPATVTAPNAPAAQSADDKPATVPVQKTRSVRRAGQHRTHLASV